MKRLLILAVATALVLPAFAQKKSAPKTGAAPRAKAPSHVPSGADEQDIVDLEKHLFEYVRAKNAKDVEPWLGDDFQYTDTRGQTYSRDQYLNHVKTVPENIDWLSADDMRVRVYGNVAVVTGVKQLRTSTGDVDIVAKPTGPPPAERSLAFTDVFRRRGSDWELVQEFAADLPSKNAAAAVPAASPAQPAEPQEPEPKRDVDSPPKISRPQPTPPGNR
jgi:hypothetical protein